MEAQRKKGNNHVTKDQERQSLNYKEERKFKKEQKNHRTIQKSKGDRKETKSWDIEMATSRGCCITCCMDSSAQDSRCARCGSQWINIHCSSNYKEKWKCHNCNKQGVQSWRMLLLHDDVFLFENWSLSKVLINDMQQGILTTNHLREHRALQSHHYSTRCV